MWNPSWRYLLLGLPACVTTGVIMNEDWDTAGADTQVETDSPAAMGGLVSWYRGEDNATDEIGANPGTMKGRVGYANGKVGHAFSFDGAGFVEIPASASLDLGWDQASTLEAWVKPEGQSSVAMPVSIVKPFTFGVLSWHGSDLLRAHVHDGAAWRYREGDVHFLPGVWHHVVQVWDRTTLTLFVDGESTPLGPLTRGFVEARENAPATLGKWDLTPIRDEVFWFHGLMDEIRVYDRALSAAEVRSNYAIGGATDSDEPVDTDAQGDCAAGYVEGADADGGRSCYRLVTAALPWEAARDACRAERSELASIHSRDEVQFLFDWCMTTPGTNCWTGGNDRDVEGRWVWTDGTPWDAPDYWCCQEPDDAWGGQDCQMIWQNWDGAGPGSDETCSVAHPYFCERELGDTDVPIDTDPPPDRGGVYSGTIAFNVSHTSTTGDGWGGTCTVPITLTVTPEQAPFISGSASCSFGAPSHSAHLSVRLDEAPPSTGEFHGACSFTVTGSIEPVPCSWTGEFTGDDTLSGRATGRNGVTWVGHNETFTTTRIQP